MMKKIIYSLLFLVSFVFGACDDDLPQANWNLHEVSNLTASPLDASVNLSWTVPSDVQPTGYYIIWTPASSGVEGGSLILDSASESSVTIEKLVNKVSYTFSVQAVYGEKRSGKASVKVTPVSSLVPPTGFTVLAGDTKAKLTWVRPSAANVKGYKVTVEPGNKVIDIADAGAESYIVSGLENNQEYTVSLQAVYDKGDSETVTATVLPGSIDPIIGVKTYVLAESVLSLEYNDMYFMGEVESVSWDFGDGTQSNESSVEKVYAAGGEYVVKVEITNADHTKEMAETTVYVIDNAWNAAMGYVKASNPVFSRDGKTFYLPTANKTGDLNAFDAETGSKKWTFAISDAITYGGGSAVGPDNVVYQAARNANLYAVSADGMQKWVYATGAANKNLDCFPALTSDGNTVYILDGDNVLHAVNTATGVAKWKKSLEGTANKAGAVAIDREGKVYAGTRSYIYAFDAMGELLWQVSAAVTEIGSFAIDGGTLYAAQTGGAGLVAINMADGQAKWSCAANGDAYAPIVGRDGAVYFVDKGGKSLYAVGADGTLKWKFDGGAALTYCFPVLDDKGIIYFGTSKGTVYAVDSKTGVEAWHMDTEATGDNAKIMAGLTIGSDKKLYVAYIGGNLTAIPVFAAPETSTWSCRGGNIYGTNQY